MSSSPPSESPPPPKMAPWNLALRFALELAALAGLALAAWHLTSGVLRWIAVVVVPLIGAGVWGTFNVLDDPSRSGEAPVEVGGPIRLALELLVLGAGAAGFAVAGWPIVALILALVIVGHYVASLGRLRWLVTR